jgi:hypothetical protein
MSDQINPQDAANPFLDERQARETQNATTIDVLVNRIDSDLKRKYPKLYDGAIPLNTEPYYEKQMEYQYEKLKRLNAHKDEHYPFSIGISSTTSRREKQLNAAIAETRHAFQEANDGLTSLFPADASDDNSLDDLEDHFRD